MIAVIISAYGKTSEQLTKCVKSVLTQEPDTEIVAIENDKGASASRNEGFKKTRGKYVFFLDADCELMPGILKEMKAILDHNPKIDFVYGDYERHGVFPENWTNSNRFIASPFNPARLAKFNYISPMSLIRRKKVVKWDEEIKRCNDWDFWLTVVIQNKGKGYYLPKVAFKTYFDKDDITNKGWKDYGYWFKKVAKKHYEMLNNSCKV